MAITQHHQRRARDKLATKLLSTALASTEFRDALAEAADEIRAEVGMYDTEATVAGVFERVLYAELKDVGLRFHPKKETAVETERHVGRGRTDSRVGQLVIEYKRPGKFEKESDVEAACRQTESYLETISRETTPAVGLVTDGRTVVEIRASDGEIDSRGPQLQLDADALRRIVRHIHALGLTALTADNLIRDLCEEDGSGALFRAAQRLYAVLDGAMTPRTGMLQAEWRAMYRLGHRDQSQQRRIEQRRDSLASLLGIRLADPAAEYRALFALHTAYAIVLKLMAARVLSEVILARQLTSWGAQLAADARALRVFCANLEDGSLFRSLGILNLLEGDFFAWYCDKAQWSDDVAEAVEGIIEVLARYEATTDLFTTTASVDLFRRLYEATVPQVVRGSFGEFHTPTWLAEDILEAGSLGPDARILDPCSGSGTVVAVAINRIRAEHSTLPDSHLLTKVTESVVGIDLNPLSVLTTRVNYFIRIADLLPEEEGDLVIPVFLGDASNVPHRVKLNGIECVEYELRTIKDPITVALPISLVAQSASFVRAMHRFEDAVHDQDAAEAARLLIVELPPSERSDAVRERIEALAARLVVLHGDGWNGIWARILTNFLSTGALQQFDLIAGNPPWIDWKNLPAGYRDEIKALAIEEHLFSGDGRTGGINLNVCALITHVSMTTWLKKSGRLVFLMPRELAVQQSYQGWRNLAGRPDLGFVEFRDWTTAGHPFDPVKEDFMTFVIGSKRRDATVPFKSYRKPRSVQTSAASWPDRATALENLDVSSGVAGQITPGSTAFTFAANRRSLSGLGLVAGECAYKGREGIEFYPQEVLLFRCVKPGTKPGTVWVRNVQVKRSKFRIPEQERLLETEFLFPLVKGPQIEPFSHAYDGLVVPFPYDVADPHKPLSQAELHRRSPLLLAMYREHEEVIRAQTGFSDSIRGPDPGDFYGLARTGPYSFASVYVAFRDNSKWRACVVESADTIWGDSKRFVFQNHAVSICERPGGGFIGREEAHYICAIFNAPTVERFIRASSDERSFKIRPPVSVPKYDRRVKAHRRLAKLSKQAHVARGASSELLAEIDKCYLER
jgi:N-6 DNA Methylase